MPTEKRTETRAEKRAALRFVPAIHRATHRIGLYLASLRDLGLSQGEAHILAHLAVTGPASIAELHGILAHKRSTLTSILDRLTDRGLITREVGEADRRTFIITPTARGQQAARSVHEHLTDLERAIASRISAADARAFTNVLAIVEEEAHKRRSPERAPSRATGPRR